MTDPSGSTSKLQRRINEVAGEKRVAFATGYSLGHVYRMARDPGDVDPEATGARNPFDHLEAYAELLATRGEEGRAVLTEIDGWWDALKDRTLDARPAPLTPERLHARITRLTLEFGDVLVQSTAEDRARLRRELGELMAAGEALMVELQD